MMTEFEKKIFSHIENNLLLENSKGLLLAVSGGPDSMAMLRFFEKNRELFSFPVGVATVDHCLRKESKEEADFVREYCEKSKIPFELLTVDIKNLCPKNMSTETFSRAVRYEFFEKTLKKLGFSHIATAHTKNDNAETLLLNLIRGTSLSGLSGIPVKRGNIIRPLLSCEKEELINYCKEENVKFFIDKTNNENVYRRNKIRNEIIPVILKENPSFFENAKNLSSLAFEDEKFISDIAKEEVEKNCIFSEEKASVLLSVRREKPVLSRVVRSAFSKICEKPLTYKMTEDILSLFSKETSSKVQIYDFYAVKTYKSVDFVKKELFKKDDFLQIKTKINTEIPFFDGIINVIPKEASYKKNKNCIKKTDLSSAVFRTVKEGDTFILKNGKKPLRRIFIDKKIPREKRGKLPVLEKDGKILWAAEVGASYDFRADGDEFYEIVYQKI